jgi:HEAT repeat protein
MPYESWEYWWAFNRTALLADQARRRDTATNAEAYTLGRRDVRAEVEGIPVRVDERSSVARALLEAVNDPCSDVRMASVIALGRLGSSQIAQVAPLVLGDDLELGRSIAIALGTSGDPAHFELLADVLDGRTKQSLRSDVPPSLRAFSIAALSLLARSSVELRERIGRRLIEALDPKEPRDVRVCAVTGLGLLPGAGGISHLMKLVIQESEDDLVRAHALGALGRLGHEEALPLAVAALRDRSVHVQRSAVLALGSLGRTDIDRCRKNLMVVMNRGSDLQSRLWAAISLGRLGGAEARSYLLEAVVSDRGSSSSFAALGLALCTMDGARLSTREVEALVRALVDGADPRTRGAYAIALGLAGATSATDRLLREVEEGHDPALRGYCAEALGLLGVLRAIPVLSKVLEERPDPGLLRPAATALGLLGGQDVVAALVEQVRVGSSHLDSLHAAEALGLLRDSSAREPLEKLLRDPRSTEGVREAAAVALGLVCAPTRVDGVELFLRDINYRAFVPALHELVAIF